MGSLISLNMAVEETGSSLTMIKAASARGP